MQPGIYRGRSLIGAALVGCCLLFTITFAADPAKPKAAAPAAGVAAGATRQPASRFVRSKPPERISEMLHWLAREQMSDGGWTFRLRLLLRYHLNDHEVPPEQFDTHWPGTVPDTAIAGLAFLRAGQRLNAGTYGDNVRHAAEFLYQHVTASAENAICVEPATHLTARIGPQSDAFLSLLFFSELRGNGTDEKTLTAHYDRAIELLVKKICDHQLPDGSWDDGLEPGSNAPLLSHALGVWALESAVRHGIKIDPKALDKAEQYALSPDAAKAEWKHNGKWKKDKRAQRPKHLIGVQACDEEPVNYEVYLSAARLSVLYQADLTRRWQLSQDLARIKADPKSATNDELVALRDRAAAAKASRQTLESARDSMRKAFGKVGKDAAPSPAPVLFTGEDFLACLLTVDAMAECKDVTQWFEPVEHRLMYFQDEDGGLRSDKQVTCEHFVTSDDSTVDTFAMIHNRDCVPPFHPWPEWPEGDLLIKKGDDLLPNPADLRRPKFVSTQFCEKDYAWCSKDRTTITAAGLMTLLADTPYRAAMLGLKASTPAPAAEASGPAK